MGRQNAITITKRAVECGGAVIWDRDLAGFGVRVYDRVALPGVGQAFVPNVAAGWRGRQWPGFIFITVV